MTRDVKIKVGWFSSEHRWKRKNLWISAENDWISMRAQPGTIFFKLFLIFPQNVPVDALKAVWIPFPKKICSFSNFAQIPNKILKILVFQKRSFGQVKMWFDKLNFCPILSLICYEQAVCKLGCQCFSWNFQPFNLGAPSCPPSREIPQRCCATCQNPVEEHIEGEKTLMPKNQPESFIFSRNISAFIETKRKFVSPSRPARTVLKENRNSENGWQNIQEFSITYEKKLQDFGITVLRPPQFRVIYCGKH